MRKENLESFLERRCVVCCMLFSTTNLRWSSSLCPIRAQYPPSSSWNWSLSRHHSSWPWSSQSFEENGENSPTDRRISKSNCCKNRRNPLAKCLWRFGTLEQGRAGHHFCWVFPQQRPCRSWRGIVCTHSPKVHGPHFEGQNYPVLRRPRPILTGCRLPEVLKCPD